MSEFHRLIDVDKYNKELEKNLEYYKRKSKRLQEENNALITQNEFLMKRDNKCQMLEQQAKEFAKWLEENWNTTQDIWYIKILQKYKEMIGVADD